MSWINKLGTGLVVLVLVMIAGMGQTSDVLAASATTSVHIVKYAADGTTILAQKTVDYKWMQANLPVQGDGKTHYYHQGPIFQGDMWDPQELNNLKDKGAVEGTAFKDLCDLVGGMQEGDEVMAVAVDGWYIKFAYQNIYQPLAIQGPITLCWYNGDTTSGEQYGVGYAGQNGYYDALQIVFMAQTTNANGQHVFGNTDMKIALPEGKYQYFYEGKYASTNGLSGKWITELRIYTGGAPPDATVGLQNENVSEPIPWLLISLGAAALVVGAGLAVYVLRTKRKFPWWRKQI